MVRWYFNVFGLSACVWYRWKWIKNSWIFFIYWIVTVFNKYNFAIDLNLALVTEITNVASNCISAYRKWTWKRSKRCEKDSDNNQNGPLEIRWANKALKKCFWFQNNSFLPFAVRIEYILYTLTLLYFR